MEKYVIVSILTPQPPASFIQSEWPLHVTLLRPFSTELPPEIVVSKFTVACKDQKIIATKGKSKELFGPDNDVPVTELELTTELQLLHTALKTDFEGEIEFTSAQYPDFRAHVTKNLGRQIGVGELVELKTVSLVKLEAPYRTIIETLELD
jgi:hypothetical protein